MKGKKGFTLVEVLGVVALLGLIIAIAIPVYQRTSNSTKEKAYENKAEQIEIAAEKWAGEINLSNPKTITVNYLIMEGYYSADEVDGDTNIVTNPKNGEDMTCYTIDVTVENETPDAHLNEESNCALVITEEMDKHIIIDAFRFDPTSNKVLDVENFKLENNLKVLEWTNSAVLLVISSEEYSGYTRVMYSSSGITETKDVTNNLIDPASIKRNQTIDPNAYANAYVVDASIFLNTQYNISIYTSEGTKTTDTTVRIDKEPAAAHVINDSNWSNANKVVTIQGSDGNGSGLKGFYIHTSETFNSNLELIETDYEAQVTRQEGTYFVWTLDNAGNTSDHYVTSFNVTNIDATDPVITDFEPHFTNNPGYTYNTAGYITVGISDSESGINHASYCLTSEESCDPTTNLNLDATAKGTVTFPTQKEANRLCVKAVDNVGNETVKCDTKSYLVDGTAPINTSVSYDTSSVGTLNVSGTDTESDIGKVVCRYGSTPELTDSVEGTKNGSSYTCDLGNLNSGTRYYAIADVYNNAGTLTSTSTINFTPLITPQIAFEDICEGQTYCNPGIYVKYGNYIFVIYKGASNNYWALLNGTYGTGKVIDAGCCDCTCCYYSNSNLGSAKNSLTTAVKDFYNQLPSSKSTKLVSTYQPTGYFDGRTNTDRTSARGWTSPVGLLNYTDWYNIRNYSYARTTSEYALSTVYVDGSIISASYYDGTQEAPYAILVNGPSMRHSSNPLDVVTARPLIIINGSITFDGGNGTLSNPYIMN